MSRPRQQGPTGSEPSCPVIGERFFDTTLGTSVEWNRSCWNSMGGGGGGGSPARMTSSFTGVYGTPADFALFTGVTVHTVLGAVPDRHRGLGDVSAGHFDVGGSRCEGRARVASADSGGLVEREE